MFHFLSTLTKISSFSWISVFEFNPKIDSLLEVSKEDYESCKVTNAIKEYKDGKTKVELDKSGPFYFISKAKGSCEKGQKLTVVVLSNKHHHKHSPSPASAPGAQAPGAQAPGPALPPYTPPNGAIGLRGGFIGIVVGIVSLVGMIIVFWGRCKLLLLLWVYFWYVADCKGVMWTLIWN